MPARTIYCCGCGLEVQARLTDGGEIYPHRPDLHRLPFWRCDGCRNYVGCHHKTADRTRPLGNIPTAELKAARQRIHALLDPLWQRGLIQRNSLYQLVARELGTAHYHTAELRTVAEAERVLAMVVRLAASLRDERTEPR